MEAIDNELPGEPSISEATRTLAEACLRLLCYESQCKPYRSCFKVETEHVELCHQVLGALRSLQPRLYSISSSQREHPARVQVTVAVVRYTSLTRERIGVPSTYLAARMQVSSPSQVC